MIMKKLQMLALALVIGVSSAFASTASFSPDPELLKKEIRSQIAELLDEVDFTVNSEKTVNITFTFSSEGEIVVLKIDTNDGDVVRYIRENLNYKKIETPGTRDKHYTMPLTIKEA